MERKAIKDPVLKNLPATFGSATPDKMRFFGGLLPGLRLAALFGLIIGTLGLIISLRLLVRFWQVLAAFASLSLDAAAQRLTPFDNWASPFSAFPLLMLLLWLISASLLLVQSNSQLATRNPFNKSEVGSIKLESSTDNRQSATGNPVPSNNQPLTTNNPSSNSQLATRNSKLLFSLLLLLIVVGLAWGQRAAQLLPDSAGRFPQPNYDEMVYYWGSATFASGHTPYRDFFTAHPPGVYLVFAAFFKLFNLESGGPDTFLAGRAFSLFQGLLTTALVFWTAGRFWAGKTRNFALLAAFVAGLVYALDGRASEIAVLENLSNLGAIAALACLLEGERRPQKRWWLLVAGSLAAFTALAKLPGLALVFALVLYLVLQRDWRGLKWFGTGFGSVSIILEVPFLIMAGPGEILRQQVFFQILRPQEVREGLDQLGRIAAYPEASLTIWLGGLGFIWLGWKIFRQRDSRLLIPALWSFPLLFIFIFSKSYHNWYFVQWALPLALLSGGLFSDLKFSPQRTQRLHGSQLATRNSQLILDNRQPTTDNLISASCLLILFLSLPFAWQEWQTERKVDYDRVYAAAGAFVKGQPPGASQMFALDPGYNLFSGLTAGRLPNGKYLVDGSSYILYLNLDIDRSSLGKLVGQSLGFGRDRAKIEEVFGRERGQALVTLGVPAGGWVALDGKIALPQLTPRSVEYLTTPAGPGKAIDYVTLYRLRSLSVLHEWQFDNNLRLTPFGLSTSFESKANFDRPNPGGSIILPAKVVATRTLDLRFVWRVLARPAQQLKVFVHLIDERGTTVAQRDVPPVSEATDTRQWQTGDAFQDVQALPLPANLGPGRYRVVTGLYAADTGQRILLQGQDSLTLGELVIE